MNIHDSLSNSPSRIYLISLTPFWFRLSLGKIAHFHLHVYESKTRWRYIAGITAGRDLLRPMLEKAFHQSWNLQGSYLHTCYNYCLPPSPIHCKKKKKLFNVTVNNFHPEKKSYITFRHLPLWRSYICFLLKQPNISLHFCHKIYAKCLLHAMVLTSIDNRDKNASAHIIKKGGLVKHLFDKIKCFKTWTGAQLALWLLFFFFG